MSMCTQPVFIKNKNFIPFGPLRGAETNNSKYSYLHNTQISYIAVPCGHCLQCRQMQQQFITQRAREEFKESYCVFITLTYQNSTLPYLQLGAVRHPYADLRDFQLFIKRIRKSGDLPPFKYLCCREFGGDKHRPHFHALLFFKRELFDKYSIMELSDKVEHKIKTEWKRKIGGTTFAPVYEPLSKFVKLPNGTGTYDCHLVTENRGNSTDPTDVAFYVSKYCLKYDTWLESKRGMLWHNYPEEYKTLWSYFRPRLLMSKGFGLTDSTPSFIFRCIEFSKNNGVEFPQYYTEDKKGLQLSRYYKEKFLTPADKAVFIVRNPSQLRTDDSDLPLDATVIVDYSEPTRIREESLRNKHFQSVLDNLYKSSDDWLTWLDDSNPSESDYFLDESYCALLPRGVPVLDYDLTLDELEQNFEDDGDLPL